jgi:hypothetical protein
MIHPFNDYDLTGDPAEAARQKAWNCQLSSVQIFVEHAFGWLKGHFPYLHMMPGQDLTEVYHIIEALMIVHNILEKQGDDPTTIAGFNGQEDDNIAGGHAAAPDDNVQESGGDELYRQGLLRRKILITIYLTTNMINTNYS